MDTQIVSFAIDAHVRTNHLYDGKPYSVHLSMVAYYASKYIDCIPNDWHKVVLDACWLHDTIEDCRLTYNDIKQVAGEEVANIVYAVTNEKGRNRKERASEKYYEGIRNTVWAKYVKLCDRLANIKYSRDTNSRMFKVYAKEHDDFINKLFPNGVSSKSYSRLLEEMSIILTNTPSPVTTNNQ